MFEGIDFQPSCHSHRNARFSAVESVGQLGRWPWFAFGFQGSHEWQEYNIQESNCSAAGCRCLARRPELGHANTSIQWPPTTRRRASSSPLKHVFVGSEDSRDSVEQNQALTTHATLGFLGRPRSDLRFKPASTLLIRRALRPVLCY
jgi:hypothetical protein